MSPAAEATKFMPGKMNRSFISRLLAMLHELDQPTLVEIIEKSSNVGIKNVVHLLPQEHIRQRIQRLMLAAPRAKPIGKAEKVFLVNLVEDGNHCLLDKFVF